MTQHVTQWIPAYHDGELSARLQRQVEAHLQDCPSCRAELDALQSLSSLLKSAPAPDQTPPSLFAAQVALRLPRTKLSRPRPPQWRLAIPLALIGFWAFIHTGLRLVAFVLTADWLVGDSLAPLRWIETDSLLRTTATLTVLNLGLLIITVILWACWMALWVAWDRHQTLLAASKA